MKKNEKKDLWSPVDTEIHTGGLHTGPSDRRPTSEAESSSSSANLGPTESIGVKGRCREEAWQIKKGCFFTPALP